MITLFRTHTVLKGFDIDGVFDVEQLR